MNNAQLSMLSINHIQEEIVTIYRIKCKNNLIVCYKNSNISKEE
jgi:hypothetical protein